MKQLIERLTDSEQEMYHSQKRLRMNWGQDLADTINWHRVFARDETLLKARSNLGLRISVLTNRNSNFVLSSRRNALVARIVTPNYPWQNINFFIFKIVISTDVCMQQAHKRLRLCWTITTVTVFLCGSCQDAINRAVWSKELVQILCFWTLSIVPFII
jgi:hypothetical protein